MKENINEVKEKLKTNSINESERNQKGGIFFEEIQN